MEAQILHVGEGSCKYGKKTTLNPVELKISVWPQGDTKCVYTSVCIYL